MAHSSLPHNHAVLLPTSAADSISGTISHFFIGDACYAGDERAVEGALAFYQSGPFSAALTDSIVSPGACSASGVVHEATCYADIDVFHASHDAQSQHHELLDGALKVFASGTNVSHDFARRLAACSCHPASATARDADATNNLCNVTELGVGSMTHILYGDGEGGSARHETLCSQGPWQHQLAVLAASGSSPLLMLHRDDALLPVGCAQRGFEAYLGARITTAAALDRPANLPGRVALRALSF